MGSEESSLVEADAREEAASYVKQRYCGKPESFRTQPESAHRRANFGWRDLKRSQERYSEF